MELEPGQVVEGRYRLLARRGAGAYGVVFRARDLETRDEVAIKFLKRGAADPSLLQRFEREAIAMARLRGTAAVYVHALGRLADGSAYIVMELLHGRELERYLKEAERAGGRLKAHKTLELLRPIARTLEAAHGQGIIHRDLKPGNIFVVDPEHGGGVRLMDFGLVKVMGADSLTADGMVAGTPSYIAPEAWRGVKHLDHRIDVYSLGVIVFRCLSGRTPSPTQSLLGLCEWAQKGERPSLHQLRKSLPESIDAWVHKALAAQPEDRFQTVGALWSSLESILVDAPASPF